jgi:hypothetical protein
MNDIITPALFYLIVIAYAVGIQRNKGYKALFNPAAFNKLKYTLGAGCFFFVNINILFLCSLCGHCYDLCIAFTLVAVLAGAAVYLTHLSNQTINAMKKTFSGEKGDFMAPFFSIPYIWLLYDIATAILHSGIGSLHANESKMLIVLLYPLFVVLSELNSKN